MQLLRGGFNLEKRIGVIAIIVEEDSKVSTVNAILSEHSSIIVGRMGIPYKEKGVNVISIIVDGSTDRIGSITGRLGKINGVSVKSALTKK